MSITWPRDTTRPFVRGPRRIATEIVGALRARKLIALRQKTERLKDRAIEEAIMLSIQYIRDCGDGDLAEFGVHNGRYAAIACRELNLYSQRRNVHLFDSFKGYPPLEAADRSAAQVVAGTFRPGPHHGHISPDALARRLRGRCGCSTEKRRTAVGDSLAIVTLHQPMKADGVLGFRLAQTRD